jgi:hypothetical protein
MMLGRILSEYSGLLRVYQWAFFFASDHFCNLRGFIDACAAPSHPRAKVRRFRGHPFVRRDREYPSDACKVSQ